MPILRSKPCRSTASSRLSSATRRSLVSVVRQPCPMQGEHHHHASGLRVLHFALLGQGVRESVRLRHLSSWLFLHVPNSHTRHAPTSVHLLRHRRGLRREPRRYFAHKNLLHLGEDRYLTTLVLKHFGKYKTIFVRDCKAWTVAPDDWKVLLSQRRRWINSTVHNLVELIFTPGLCGFCLFSMRFIVFIVFAVDGHCARHGSVYCLLDRSGRDQRRFGASDGGHHAGCYLRLSGCHLLAQSQVRDDWMMIIYIFGIPIWSLFLPLYSFWHMDDFSWGNTRVVMGEKGQKMVLHEEGTFDPAEIPLQTWTDYENELWERNSARSIGSLIEAARAENKSLGSRAGSQYAPSLYGQPVMPTTEASVTVLRHRTVVRHRSLVLTRLGRDRRLEATSLNRTPLVNRLTAWAACRAHTVLSLCPCTVFHQVRRTECLPQEADSCQHNHSTPPLACTATLNSRLNRSMEGRNSALVVCPASASAAAAATATASAIVQPSS